MLDFGGAGCDRVPPGDFLMAQMIQGEVGGGAVEVGAGLLDGLRGGRAEEDEIAVLDEVMRRLPAFHDALEMAEEFVPVQQKQGGDIKAHGA